MKILFTRWSLDPASRTPVAVEPKRVDCVELFSPAMTHSATGEAYPPATKIIMQGKQEYIVQGSVEDVTERLNGEPG